MEASVWSKRYELINDFEKMLHENGTRILKFYLHISPDEQLERFKQRLDGSPRYWKISETDYSERELWSDYIEAFEDAMERTSTRQAPWYVIPSNHKWFRNLAISEIVADTMEDMASSCRRRRSTLQKFVASITPRWRNKCDEVISCRTRRIRSKHTNGRKDRVDLRNAYGYLSAFRSTLLVETTRFTLRTEQTCRPTDMAQEP